MRQIMTESQPQTPTSGGQAAPPPWREYDDLQEKQKFLELQLATCTKRLEQAEELILRSMTRITVLERMCLGAKHRDTIAQEAGHTAPPPHWAERLETPYKAHTKLISIFTIRRPSRR